MGDRGSGAEDGGGRKREMSEKITGAEVRRSFITTTVRDESQVTPQLGRERGAKCVWGGAVGLERRCVQKW